MAIAPVTSIRPVARTDSPAKKGVGDGIGARQEQKAEELGFFDKVSNLFTILGGKALQQGKPEKQDNRTLHMEVYKEMDMQDEARRSAELLRQDRQGAGITRSLTPEEWAQRYSNEKAITPNTTAPFWYQGKEYNEALDVAPVEITAVPTQSAPVGLMSPPTAGTTPAAGGTDLMSSPQENTEQTQESFDAEMEPLASNVVFSNPQMSLIVALEGFKAEPYSLNSDTNLAPLEHRSGLTVANGLDVGQHTRDSLLELGFTESIIDKFGDWIGLNPDTIVDPDYSVPAEDLTLTNIQEIVGATADGIYGPATERRILTYLADNGQPEPSRNVSNGNGGRRPRTPAEWQEILLDGVRRVRGHSAMADTFQQDKDNGTLPSFSLAELETMAEKSWQTLGIDKAKRIYGEGFDNLSDSVKAVLASEVYVSGDLNDPNARRAVARARAGRSAADVAAALPERHGRKDRLETWLANNSFSDERAMSNQGLQIMTNRLMDSLGVEGARLTVDSLIGAGTRQTVDTLLREQGKVGTDQNIDDATRKKLIEELYYETVVLPPATTQE